MSETVARFNYGRNSYEVVTKRPNIPRIDGSPDLVIRKVAGPPDAPYVRTYSLFTNRDVIAADTERMRDEWAQTLATWTKEKHDPTES